MPEDLDYGSLCLQYKTEYTSCTSNLRNEWRSLLSTNSDIDPAKNGHCFSVDIQSLISLHLFI